MFDVHSLTVSLSHSLTLSLSFSLAALSVSFHISFSSLLHYVYVAEPVCDASEQSTESRLYSLINHPPFQRTLCKSVYTDIWARSYIEAHGLTQAKNIAPKQFSNSVAGVAGADDTTKTAETTTATADSKKETDKEEEEEEEEAAWDPLDLLGDSSDSAAVVPLIDEEENNNNNENDDTSTAEPQLSGGSLLAASLRNDAKLFEAAEPSMKPVIALLKELAAEHEGKARRV
jgi:hypothetical protein